MKKHWKKIIILIRARFWIVGLKSYDSYGWDCGLHGSHIWLVLTWTRVACRCKPQFYANRENQKMCYLFREKVLLLHKNCVTFVFKKIWYFLPKNKLSEKKYKSKVTRFLKKVTPFYGSHGSHIRMVFTWTSPYIYIYVCVCECVRARVYIYIYIVCVFTLENFQVKTKFIWESCYFLATKTVTLKKKFRKISDK